MVYGKNTGKANGTTDIEQALKEAIAKRTKKLESGYFEDVNNINEQQYFEPMLAAKWDYNEWRYGNNGSSFAGYTQKDWNQTC